MRHNRASVYHVRHKLFTQPEVCGNVLFLKRIYKSPLFAVFLSMAAPALLLPPLQATRGTASDG